MARVQAMLLNADGSYHQMHTSLRAIRLALANKVSVIYWWDPSVAVLTAATEQFKIPALMVYNEYIHLNSLNRPAALTRENLFRRDGFVCQYCGKGYTPSHLTLDHIIPQDRGGPTTWENSTTACKKCNNKKSNRTPQEARMPLLSKPTVPRFITFRNPRRAKLVGKIHESWIPYLGDQ